MMTAVMMTTAMMAKAAAMMAVAMTATMIVPVTVTATTRFDYFSCIENLKSLGLLRMIFKINRGLE